MNISDQVSVGHRLTGTPTLEANRLSWKAIELATEHPSKDLREITSFLYFYNRLPLDRTWCRQMNDVQTAGKLVGLDIRHTWPNSRKYFPKHPTDVNPVWYFWYPNGRDTRTYGRGTIKLYVCPYFADMEIVIHTLGRCLDDSGAKAVKVGLSPAALLRPDKLIFYFDEFAAAMDLGSKLNAQVCIQRAQATPFSYLLDTSGLTAIGYDPPATARWLDGGHGNSWRLWIAEVVADQILRRRAANNPIEAISRGIQRCGINPLTWQPLGSAMTIWAQ
jgi:hypothetical protein